MRLMGVDEKGSPVAGNARHDETIADGRKLIEKAKKQMMGGGSAASTVGGAGGSAGSKAAGLGGRKGDIELATSSSSSVSAVDRYRTGPVPPSVPGRFKTLDSFSGVGGASRGGPEVVGIGAATTTTASSSGGGGSNVFSTAFNSMGQGVRDFNSRALAAFGQGGHQSSSSAAAAYSSPSGPVPSSSVGGGRHTSTTDFSSVALTLEPMDSGPVSLAAKLKGKRTGGGGLPSSSSSSNGGSSVNSGSGLTQSRSYGPLS